MYFIRHTSRDQNPKHNPQMRRQRAQYSDRAPITEPVRTPGATEQSFRSDGVRVIRLPVLSRSVYVPHVGKKQLARREARYIVSFDRATVSTCTD